MISKRVKKNNAPELIIEPHPINYDGVPWATLIQYVGKNHLVVVNTLESDYLWGYSIESMSNKECNLFCQVMEAYWYTKLYDSWLREYISPDQWITERGVGSIFGKLMIAYNTENVVRVIGPIRRPDIVPPKRQIRRRKRVNINRSLIVKKL